jgi:hypothetical protein
MALLDHPPPFCKTYIPSLVVPLILHVSPPPGLSDPAEFFYDLLHTVTHGSFAAACAYFLAHGHQVMTLKCLDLDAFIAALPGAVVCLVSTLPLLSSLRATSFYLTRWWLVSCLWWMSLPLGMAPLTLLPDCSSTATQSSRWLPPHLFAMVLPSPIDGPVQGMGPPAASSLRPHGGPPPHPDPDGVNKTPSVRYTLPRLWGYGLRPVPGLPPCHALVLLPTPMGDSSTEGEYGAIIGLSSLISFVGLIGYLDLDNIGITSLVGLSALSALSAHWFVVVACRVSLVGFLTHRLFCHCLAEATTAATAILMAANAAANAAIATSTTEIANVATSYFHTTELLHVHSFVRKMIWWWLDLARKRMW